MKNEIKQKLYYKKPKQNKKPELKKTTMYHVPVLFTNTGKIFILQAKKERKEISS